MYRDILEQQLAKIKRLDKPVIIFGTMLMGMMAEKALRALGITPACFCDNDANKHGLELNGIEILSLNDVRKRYEEAIFIVAVFQETSFKVISKQLKEIGYKNIYDKDAVQYAYYVYYLGRKENSEKIAEALDICGKKERCIIEYLCVFTTERCTLNCKYCSACIPYIDSPKDADIKKLVKNLNKIAASVDCIKNISVAGGESLLHENLVEFCREVSKIGNILNINIFTNGNTLISEEKMKMLSKYISKIHITDYGENSKQEKQLIAMAEKYGVICEYKLEEVSQWVELGNFIERKNSNLNISNCEFPIATTMSESKLFYCGRGRVIDSLFPNLLTEEDYIDLGNEKKDNQTLKKEIRNMVLNTTHLNYCKYCNGHLGKKVKAGEQIKGKLDKKLLLEV